MYTNAKEALNLMLDVKRRNNMSLALRRNWGTILCLIVGIATVWCNAGPSAVSAESVFAGYSGAGSCNCGIDNTSCRTDSGCSGTKDVCSAGMRSGSCIDKSGLGSKGCDLSSCDPKGVANKKCG